MKNYFGILNSATDHLLREAISANNYGSYQDPPLYQGDPYTIYSEEYLEEQVVPMLVKETKKFGPYFPKGNIITM